MNSSKLFLAIREHKTGNPQLDNTDYIKGLLTQVQNINDIDLNDNDNTPLHVAVSKEHQDIVKLLLNVSGIDVNIANKQGNTPLHIALSKDNKELVQLILSKHANIDVKNNKDKKPLESAENPEFVNILQAETSSQTKQSTNDVDIRLNEFVEDFVTIYESYLSEYHKRLEERIPKEGKWAFLINDVLEIGKRRTEETQAIKAPSIVNNIQKLLTYTGTKYNWVRLKKLKNSSEVRKLLVESSIDVFRSFENQFIQVTSKDDSKSWQRAIEKLADDAVNRVISYYKENPEKEFSSSTITEGIILGESKRGSAVKLRKGHHVMMKDSDGKDFISNTADLFENIGLLIKDSDDYYTKKSSILSSFSKSPLSDKYGFRLIFKWEDCGKKIENDRVLTFENDDRIYTKVQTPSNKYKYLLTEERLKDKQKEMLDKLDDQDKIVEERLKMTLQQVKQTAEVNSKELIKYIEDNFDEIKKQGDEIKQELDELKQIVKTDLEVDKKTLVVVEKTNQGVNQLRVGQGEIKQNLAELPDKVAEIFEKKNTYNKEPIWFDVRESVTSFTGREEQLKKIAKDIQQGIVVIIGLPGVGKSELAIRYAHDYSKDYKGNVVWINAETHNTAQDSFRRLMKELRLKTRDQDGDEKSVGLMAKEVYFHFNDKIRLFIFDNAENYSIIKEFLPRSTSEHHVLITSQNRELFNMQEHGKLEVLSLEPLPEDKAIKFVKKELNINDELQDKDIKKLVETLGYLPLALQNAVAYIKESGFGKCLQVYIKSEQEQLFLLNRVGLSSYGQDIFATFKTTIDKVKVIAVEQEENGELAAEILNTIAYFSPDNIPKGVFLKLAQDRVQENNSSIKNIIAYGILSRMFSLINRYSVINLREEQVSIHRLVQQVIRSELGKQSEEQVLTKSLELLKEYSMAAPKNAASCIPHIISIWDYASKYDELIKKFIVDTVNNKATTSTTYFDLIIEASNYEVIDDVIKKISPDNLNEVINARNKDNATPLHKAVLRNDKKIVELLIKHHADVNAKKNNGWTPLHFAAKNGDLGVVNALLEKNANVDDKTKYQFTPLHLAARNGHKEVTEALLTGGANVNAGTGYDFTPLHLAADNGHYGAVQALLQNDQIIINAETNYKCIPLHLAAKKNHLSIVEALLGKNSDVNAQNKDGFTPLHFAALYSYAEIFHKLIENNKINIDTRTIKGNTPLHLAAEKGYLNIVKAIIAKNADVGIKNEDGNTASDLAHPEVKDYILSIYKRTKGAAGIEGQLCEINLSIFFLLKGITDERISEFHLASNMEKADKFDDLVFKYEYKESIPGKSKTIFLQSKHKTDQKGVNINSILSDSETGDFSLNKYFISYRKIKQQFSEIQGPLFSSKFEDSEFIIYTNAPFDCDDSIFKENNTNLNDLLTISGSQNKYYQLEFNSNTKKRIVKLLENSSDSRRLARELVRSISSGRGMDMQKDIFNSYHIALHGKVIEKIENKLESYLSKYFLHGDASLSLEDKEFRRVFFDEAENVFKKRGDELKQELQNKVIKLSNKFGTNSGSGNLQLPNDDPITEDEIKDFLNKFKFFANQPSEKDLEKFIKEKVKEVYKVEQQDIDSVFLEVESRVKEWWKSGNNYLTKDNKFFEDAARISINFDVKEPVTLFTGRTKELKELHEALQNKGEAVISQMASVTGLGGVGKSELARKYISIHNKDYDDNVIWINADNYFTIAESFRRLAQDKLGISTTDKNGKKEELTRIVEQVYRFFAKRHRSSLFIFDNAEKHKVYGEGDEGIDKFLPSGSRKPFGLNKPTVLITSRDREWGEIKSLPLDVFTSDEAVEFIKKALKNVVELEESDVKRLAEKLQYLPLALNHAAAYIKMENKELNKWSEGQFTINNYLEQFKEKANQLLSKEPNNSRERYTGTVMTTWEITIYKIRQKMGGEQAYEVLNIIAYLAPDKIPVAKIFSNLKSEVRNRAVELLDQYSMAYLVAGKLNIHRLVQLVTRINLNYQNKEEEFVREAFKLLEKSFPFRSDKLEDCTEKKHILPHLEAFLLHIDDWFEKQTVDEQKQVIEKDYISNLLLWMGDGYGNLGEHKRRKELLERALLIMDKHYGFEHFALSKTLNNLSNAYGCLGDHERKKKMLERTLKIEEKIYGYEHFEVARTLNNLSNAYGDLGHPQEQKELLERALSIIVKHCGPDHFAMAKVLDNLSNAYSALGNPQEQKRLLEKALIINEKHYGPAHFEVARVLRNLGTAYYDLGNPQKQKDLVERSLKIQEKHYGLEHFEVARTLSNLGNAYGALENYRKQKKVLERALPILKKHYGSEHFGVSIALGNLGNAYEGLGNHLKQKDLLEEALQIKEKYYGSDHHSITRTLGNLGNAYISLGYPNQAKDLLERALEIQEKYYGSDHYEVARTCNKLGNAYGALGNHQKQKDLLKRALKIQENHFGPENFEVAKTLVNLGNAYGAEGDYQKAYEQYEKSSKITEKQTSLHLATRSGNLETVKYVFEKGADILARNNRATVLHQAVRSGNMEVLRFILDKIREKDPQKTFEHYNAPDTEGDTPLIWAAQSGKTKVAEILLESGADFNLQNNDGETALHWAVMGGFQDIVQLLLDKQADPNVKDNFGKTPLHLAHENISKNSQVYQRIIDILRFKSTNQQQKIDSIHQDGEVS